MTRKYLLTLILLLTGIYSTINAQHSVAREWNEVHLATIRKDFGRPTHHARTLFHVTLAMYDAWAAYDSVAKPFLLGDTVGGYYTPFVGVTTPTDVKAAREEAISYAAYGVLRWRFRNSPGAAISLPLMDSLMLALGYDTAYHSINYSTGTPADLGNYIAGQIIAFGLQDGSNEPVNYANQYYTPANQPIIVKLPGNPNITDPNRWQPITLDYFIDQNGILIPGSTPPFLSPEWGNVTPFSLADSIKTVNTRDGDSYNTYYDPGPPPLMDTVNGGGTSALYQWTFSLVSTWSSHLDPADSVMWDVSPASIGNAHDYPTAFEDYPNFYDIDSGGDNSTGYAVNPKTGLPYAPQIVPRGDYTRVLAEFWADGPSSETPPGHWFTIINYVNDHSQFVKRWGGKGPIVDDLEWDVKAYFAMGGAMHDVAIAVWGIKGWYDYVRPLSAIRYMAAKGQSTDTTLANYSPQGIPLIPGFIEVVQSGDPLDTNGMYAGEIKLRAWRGPNYVANPATSVAGVDWILADRWWPYQRPTFVTPPFAGYISGHSSYSRTAAELMTLMTGDEYFPGGMSEFHAPMNQFLVFEDGPSMDVTLQWAKYKDASDQCSLSRIWGGIHPPADDIPGRLLGMRLGPDAFHYAERLFDSKKPVLLSVIPSTPIITDSTVGNATFTLTVRFAENMDSTIKPNVTFPVENPLAKTLAFNSSRWVDWNTYEFTYDVSDSSETLLDIDVRVSGGKDVIGNEQEPFDAADNFSINTVNPTVVNVTANTEVISDADAGVASFTLTVEFNEIMNNTVNPTISFPFENPLINTLTLNSDSSTWENETTYQAKYDVADLSEELFDIDVRVAGATNEAGNEQGQFDDADNFSIDTKNPIVVSVTPSQTLITVADAGTATFWMTVLFDESMDTTIKFPVAFPSEDPSSTLTYNPGSSEWTNTTSYIAKYDVANSSQILTDIDLEVATTCTDLVGNMQLPFSDADEFSIDMATGIAGLVEALLKVYPNPAGEEDLLTVELSHINSDAQIQLFNPQGKLIQSQLINKANEQQVVQLKISEMPSGLYLLRVAGKDLEHSVRVQLFR